MTDRASYSQLTAHRKCPQAWNYGYERGLEKVDPEDIAVEREFGVFWHALLAADSINRGRALGTLQYAPDTLKLPDHVTVEVTANLTMHDVLVAAATWWQQQTPLTQETWEGRLGENLPKRLDSLFLRWSSQWAEERAEEEPMAVELGWGRDLPAVPGEDDPDTRLVGYVDEVYFDTKRRMVVVRDHKTGKSLSTQTTADDLMDSQLQFYAWGATPIVKEWGRGPIRATAYDRVRSVKAKTPQVTQSGTLSKSITDFDLWTYLEWATGPDGLGVPFPGRLKDGSGAGRYVPEEVVIEKLSSPAATTAWFQRTLSPLNVNMIRTHLRAAVDSALDVKRSRARVQASGEAARNLTSGCRFCDFVQLCRAEMVGGVDGEYDLADFKLRQRPPRKSQSDSTESAQELRPVVQ